MCGRLRPYAAGHKPAKRISTGSVVRTPTVHSSCLTFMSLKKVLTAMVAVWVIAPYRARVRRISGPSMVMFMGILSRPMASPLRVK